MPAFHQRIEDFRNLPLVGDVRYIGMIGALELVRDKRTKQVFDFKRRIGLDVYKRGLRKSLLLRPLGNIVYFFLPLCIKKREIKKILDITYKILYTLR
jgi:adenosylmethionine-8-amino-7-oxononanoate aminotransferase